MQVLVVNAGSSSVKLRLLDGHDALVRSTDLPAGADGFNTGQLSAVLADWPTPDVVGHASCTADGCLPQRCGSTTPSACS